MNRKFIFILLFELSFFAVKGYSQSLSLDQLTILRSKDFDAANTYLLNNRWEFYDSSPKEKYNVICWTYGREQYSGNAKAFLRHYSSPGYYNVIEYTTFNKLHYDAILKQIITYKMQRFTSKIEEGSVRTEYIGINNTIEVVLSKDDESQITAYSFLVKKKHFPDYAPNAAKSFEEINELISNDRLQYYKSLVGVSNSLPPLPEDIIYLTTSKERAAIESDTEPGGFATISSSGFRVCILSVLSDEDNEYYLVYADIGKGVYGYVAHKDLNTE